MYGDKFITDSKFYNDMLNYVEPALAYAFTVDQWREGQGIDIYRSEAIESTPGLGSKEVWKALRSAWGTFEEVPAEENSIANAPTKGLIKKGSRETEEDGHKDAS